MYLLGVFSFVIFILPNVFMVEAVGTAPTSSLHPSSFTESFLIYNVIISYFKIKVNLFFINSIESEIHYIT